jgi:hypothetical protein
MWLKKKRKADEIGTMLATLALRSTAEESLDVHRAAVETEIPGHVINNEYVILKIWLLDQSFPEDQSTDEVARSVYWQTIRSHVADRGQLDKFQAAYDLRQSEYATAWSDPLDRGWGVSMANAFMSACGSDPSRHFGDLVPLWIRASALCTEMTKYMASIRIV